MVTGEFDLGPAAFGIASTVLAVGSLAGSLAAARRGAPRIRLVVLAALAFGAAAVTVALMPTYLMFLVALPLVGMGALTLINAAQSYLQLNSEPELRGRVMGIYTLLFLGGTPLGCAAGGMGRRDVRSPVVDRSGRHRVGARRSRWPSSASDAPASRCARTCARGRTCTSPSPRRSTCVRPGGGSLSPCRLRRRARARPPRGRRTAGARAVRPLSRQSEPTPGDVDDLTSTRLADVQDERIDEASGMVVSQVHEASSGSINDSKGGESVYGVDDTGATVAVLTLKNIYNRDWEAMAPGVDDGGDPALWIADIGDNDAQWSSLPRLPHLRAG